LADVRFVASILSIPCEQRYGALPMTPQKHKDETLRTLVDIIEATARKQPSVMLFEDAHWADPRRGSEEAVFWLQMPRRNRRPVMAGFRFERGSVGRRPTSPGQVWRG
jgi:hypothetical protein